MSFVPLASSSAGNAYLVTDGGHRLGIEAGLPYRDYQRAMDFGVSKLDGVLVTHCHGDHARAVKDVMRAGVTVYSSAATFTELGLSGHRAKAVEPLKAFSVGRWTVLPFPTVHDAPDPLGFMVEGPSGARLLFLTDSAFCAYRFERLEIVALEVNYSLEVLTRRVAEGRVAPQQAARVIKSHMSLERAIDLLQANDLSRLREVHLLHMSDGSSDEAAFCEAVRRVVGRPVYSAQKHGGAYAARN